ncbi:GntR family transcriptional regulator [Aeoliella sp.]|uniref:GntR family transcriptional regulator n=1 Tax=Aeoliella sp. TaxID=2795800 RepID=UPI003CCC1CB1
MTLRQKAYDHIRGKMLRGELLPGSRLSNRKLAAEVGVSFIPVREAIGQLVSEGLAEHRSNFGAVVRNPSREEIVDLYDFRMALECHAVKTAAEHITAGEIAELRAHSNRMTEVVESLQESPTGGIREELTSELLAIDAAFHLIMLRVAGNSLVMKTVSDLRVMERVFGHRRFTWSKSSLTRICEEHSQVIDRLEERDAVGAADAMAHHISRGQKAALDAYDRRRASEAAERAFSGQLQDYSKE